LRIVSDKSGTGGITAPTEWKVPTRTAPLPNRLTGEESKAHKKFIKSLGDAAFWYQFD
jgi:DNA polymerase III subunit epsilon